MTDFYTPATFGPQDLIIGPQGGIPSAPSVPPAVTPWYSRTMTVAGLHVKVWQALGAGVGAALVAYSMKKRRSPGLSGCSCR